MLQVKRTYEKYDKIDITMTSKENDYKSKCKIIS